MNKNVAKRSKRSIGIGIVLLILLVAPVLLLCIPATGTYLQTVPHPTMQGVTNIETVEYTYIPLWNVVTNSTTDILDVVFLLIYCGLIVLAVWLIRSGLKKYELD